MLTFLFLVKKGGNWKKLNYSKNIDFEKIIIKVRHNIYSKIKDNNGR